MDMGVLFEKSLLLVVVLLSCLCVWRASAIATIPIKKIYHHRAVTERNVDWGSCVLYGNGLTKGSVTEATSINGNIEERIFFIPRAFISTSECRNMMQNINKLPPGKGYTLIIEDVKKPEPGLVVRVSYPKDSCLVACKHFDSIQREKGIVVNVYNRALVQNLKKCQKPVLSIASLHNRPVIFLDPGHGGSDAGAVSMAGVSEKDVCLAVSLEVKKILAQAGYTVYVSRGTDIPVPLDLRTYKAHEKNADLLVSIHANASENHNASGIELFFLDQGLVSDQCGDIKNEMANVYCVLQKRSELSNYLARCVHAECIKMNLKNRGIKKAVAQVLLGAYVPAILIEVGFMTHPQESVFLTDLSYQKLLAKSIATGIQNYCVNM
jgi:N-acetylmuramoyl-L-alanine amidase